MKAAALLLALALSTCAALGQDLPSSGVPNEGPVTHLVNGMWFDGTRFVKADFFIEGQYLTQHPDERRAYQEVDLHGAFIVPPYGDAHEHMFDGTANAASFVQQYLTDGIFYAQGMTDTTTEVHDVIAAGMVDTPTTVDVTYAHGGLTGVNGHPKEVYEALALGIYTGLRKDQEAPVIASHLAAGRAYWEIASVQDLDRDWPLILATKPDLIKVYLGRSEHFRQATAADSQLARGIDPALVPLIVKRAHTAELKVAAHVETPHDIHVALTAGVDELGHTLDYGLTAKDDPATAHIADADIALAAKRHVVVQATASIAFSDQTPPADLAARQKSQRNNLGRLKAAGITIVVGSDHYGMDSRSEADYLHALGLWTNLELLRIWAVTTPQDVFPKRKIGKLAEGYEASFLVLSANPLDDWSATHAITDRWKQGQHIVLAPPAPAKP